MASKKIFIVEKDCITSLDLKKKLENSGYLTTNISSFVNNGFSMKNNFPDLVVAFSDLRQMPGFDTVRAELIENKTPIICIGTLSNDETQVVCKELNIIGMYRKPFDSRDLIDFTKKYFVPEQAF